MDSKLLVLSAHFMRHASGDLRLADSTCRRFLTDFSRSLSSVTSKTTLATAAPNRSLMSSIVGSQSSTTSWSQAAAMAISVPPNSRTRVATSST